MRAVALWLYDYTCVSCKNIFTSLEVHHDDRDNKNNELTNLIPLCADCHGIIGQSNHRFNHNEDHIIILLKLKVAELIGKRN